MNFFADNLRVSKSLFLPLFALLVFYTNIDQYLNLNLEEALRSTEGAQSSVYLWGAFSVGFNLLFPLLLLLTTLYFLNQVVAKKMATLPDFLETHFSQMLIENLRSWGQIILWSFLFVIPGLWKYVQYLLVPMVVTSDSRYQSGEVDALARSSFIVKKNLFPILAVIFIFSIFFPLLTSGLFSAYRFIWKTPVASLVLSALDTYVLILSTHILYNIFRKEIAPYDDAHV